MYIYICKNNKHTRLSKNTERTEAMKKKKKSIEREDFEEAPVYPIGFYIYWENSIGQLRRTGVRT